MKWHFETDCVNSDGPSICEMKEQAVRVTYETLQRRLGPAFAKRQEELGYEVGPRRGDLRMKADWAVSYWKSRYRGRPCYYFAWSGIEQIFTQ